MIVYERIEPEGRCVSPDGHECTEAFTMCSPIPESAWCTRCGKPWTIITFDEPEAADEDS